MSSANKLYEKCLATEKSGNRTEAITLYRSLLSEHPDFRPALNNLGAIYSRSGQSQEAITLFQRALALSEDEIVHFNLGSEYFRTEKFEESEKHLISALKIARRLIKAHLLLAYLYRKTGDFKKSNIYFQNALKIEPKNRVAALGYAISLSDQERFEQSLEVAEAFLKLAPADSTIRNLRAGLLLKLNRYEESLKEMDELTQSSSGYKSFTDHLESARADSDQEYGQMFDGIDSKIKEKSEQLRTRLKNRKQQASGSSTLPSDTEEQKEQDLKVMVDLSFLHLFSGDSKKALRFLYQAKKMKESQTPPDSDS